MRKDITHHCLVCTSCAEHRPARHYESPNLSYPIPHAPWDSLSIDLLKLPLTESGNQFLLVCVDSFSRFCILVPLKDKSARSVARAFIDEVVCRYAAPRVLLSDNGSEFNNAILQAVCDSFHIRKCNIIPYSPQANGKVERANRRILDILRFIANSTSAWDDHIPLVACSLNSAIHSSINESPHFVLFGTDKRLPHELLSSAPRPLYCLDDYVKHRVHALQRIHTSVRDNLSDSQEAMLRQQHRRSTSHEIGIGDIVFHKVHDRHSKLDPLFNGPHRVVELLQGHKTKIRELLTGKECVVHKDHLKRVDRGFDTEGATPLTDPQHDSASVGIQPAPPAPLLALIIFGLALCSSLPTPAFWKLFSLCHCVYIFYVLYFSYLLSILLLLYKCSLYVITPLPCLGILHCVVYAVILPSVDGCFPRGR